MTTPLDVTTSRGSRFVSWLAAALVLLVVARTFILLSPRAFQLVALLGLAFWVVVSLRRETARRLASPIGLAIAAGTIVFLACETLLTQLASVAALLALVGRATSRGDRVRDDVLVAFPAAYAAGAIFYRFAPEMFEPLQEAALATSTWIGERVLGAPLRLGPTFLGVWFALAALGVLAARFACAERRLVPLAVGAALVPASMLAHVATLGAWIESVDAAYRPTAAMLSGITWIVVPAIAWAAAVRPRPLDTRRASSGWRLGAAATACLACTLLAELSVPKSSARIVFDSTNEGSILDWRTPRHGMYGPMSQGMFGLLPDHLEADGFDVEFHRGTVTPESLAAADVFVTINADTQWSEDELLAIWSFVERGGSLLVLGDHTDVQGTQQSQNTLLAPFGIRFQFDDAQPSRRGGFSGADMFGIGPHASVVSPEALRIGIGASLSLDGIARPVVSDPLAYSDVGNMADAERAFLGNYQHEAGEQFGDTVLVARASYGRGRVLVYGDTSSFQNISLVSTYDTFVPDIFAWLAARPVFPFPRAAFVAVIAFLACALAFAARSAQRPWMVSAYLLATTLLLGSARGLQSRWLERSPAEAIPTAWLDMSHLPRLDFSTEGKNELTGLVENLERCGLRVRFRQELDAESLRAGDALVLIAPAKTFAQDEVDGLLAFVRRGGLVLTACGYEHASSIRGLLKAVELEIGDAPVGPIPLSRAPNRRRTMVEYVEAWPIQCVAPPSRPAEPLRLEARLASSGVLAARDMRILARPADDRDAVRVLGEYDGVPLAVRVCRGHGAFVLVADSYFFGSKNIEDDDGYSLPNILFLRSILEDFQEGGS